MDQIQAFPARYESLCIPCDEQIKRGEFIIISDVGFVHEECLDDVGKAVQSNGADFDSFNPGRAPIAVLPRGKTGKDRCDRCFIVHASGQDGCE